MKEKLKRPNEINKKTEINAKVAVIGSGVVGRAWGIVFTRVGCNVSFYDALPDAASKALVQFEEMARQLQSVGLLG